MTKVEYICPLWSLFLLDRERNREKKIVFFKLLYYIFVKKSSI
nr:MAG TPA: hypothetical protein [Caudoviricetes sp.]